MRDSRLMASTKAVRRCGNALERIAIDDVDSHHSIERHNTQYHEIHGPSTHRACPMWPLVAIYNNNAVDSIAACVFQQAVFTWMERLPACRPR